MPWKTRNIIKTIVNWKAPTNTSVSYCCNHHHMMHMMHECKLTLKPVSQIEQKQTCLRIGYSAMILHRENLPLCISTPCDTSWPPWHLPPWREENDLMSRPLHTLANKSQMKASRDKLINNPSTINAPHETINDISVYISLQF